MPIILKRDQYKYVPAEEIRIQRKFGGKIAGAIFLPRGNGISDLFNFFTTNKDNIKAITDTVSGIAGAASNIGNFASNTAKSIEEIKALRQRNLQLAQPQNPITEQALNNIVNDNEPYIPKPVKPLPKKSKGSAFYYV